MTDNRGGDEFTAAMTAALRPVAEQVIADAIKPWRRLSFWLAVAFVLLAGASVVQWWVIP